MLFRHPTITSRYARCILYETKQFKRLTLQKTHGICKQSTQTVLECLIVQKHNLCIIVWKILEVA